MKAAILRKFNEISIEELPKPILEPEEALIKIKYASICGSDIHIYLGQHPTAKLPLVLGHEFVGELVEINTNKKTNLDTKEKVVVQPYRSCGVCDLCIQGRDNICYKLNILGVHSFGSFAEYIKVPVNRIYKFPINIDLKLGALVEPLAVAVHNIRKSNFQVGQTVFVIGGGPIGIMIAIVARLSGASKIVISEINDYRIEFAQKLNFTTVNPKEMDIVQEALMITDGAGFDVVYEVSGSEKGMNLMTKIVKIGGAIMLVGFPIKKYIIDEGCILAKEIELKGARLHKQIDFRNAIDILKMGVINNQISNLITKEFLLTDIKEAIRFSIEDQKHLKVLLKN